MSKLDKFLGTPKEVEVPILGIVKLAPLRVQDLFLFEKKRNETEEQQTENSKQIMIRSLRMDENGFTLEWLNELPLASFNEIVPALMEEINKINGFDGKGTAIERIKEQVAAKKAGQ